MGKSVTGEKTPIRCFVETEYFLLLLFFFRVREIRERRGRRIKIIPTKDSGVCRQNKLCYFFHFINAI